jgi:muconolactone delta-isomerase
MRRRLKGIRESRRLRKGINMLYHVQFNIDHQALGFDARRNEVSAAEAERAVAIQAEGRLLGIWRRADLSGAIFVIDAESHEALRDELSSLPLFPFLRSIEVTPLVPHPRFPEFGQGRLPD